MSSSALPRFLLLVPASLLAACGPLSAQVLSGDESGESSTALTLAPEAGAQLLALVNYPGTDLGVLDQAVGLDRRAAANVLAHRDGADRVSPSADDDRFDTIAELDAVPFVGDAAFGKLLAYAQAHPAPRGEIVEGVSFQGWEAELVVWGVNTLELSALDGVVEARAAQNLLTHRPYTTVTQLGAVAWVGPSALERLRGVAGTWWAARRGQASLAGTFDGVAFDAPTAATALEIANAATAAQLVSKGLASTGANAIVAGRPFATLAAIAGLNGVGPVSMQALATWARSGTWGAPVPTMAELRAALEAASADLWMPSETDARFVFLEGQQLDGAPITESVVRAQLTAQHDALISTVMYTDPSERSLAAKTQVEERDAVAFFDTIIDNADPNDAVSLANAQKFATLKQALQTQLTDLKVYRFGRISISTFIVGRTPSGELVALLTGQVET